MNYIKKLQKLYEKLTEKYIIYKAIKKEDNKIIRHSYYIVKQNDLEQFRKDMKKTLESFDNLVREVKKDTENELLWEIYYKDFDKTYFVYLKKLVSVDNINEVCKWLKNYLDKKEKTKYPDYFYNVLLYRKDSHDFINMYDICSKEIK